MTTTNKAQEDSPESSKDATLIAGNRPYRDFFHETVSEVKAVVVRPTCKRKGPPGGVAVIFTETLYRILEDVEEEGREHIITWQPHGRSFAIHNPHAFAKDIMPR